MEKRKTLKENFVEVAEVLTNAGRTDLADFINGRIELIEKKASKPSKSPNAEANAKIKIVIMETLAELGKATITELLNANAELNELAGGSNQRVSALVKQLKDEGKVIRTEEKRKAYFALASE